MSENHFKQSFHPRLHYKKYSSPDHSFLYLTKLLNKWRNQPIFEKLQFRVLFISPLNQFVYLKSTNCLIICRYFISFNYVAFMRFLEKVLCSHFCNCFAYFLFIISAIYNRHHQTVSGLRVRVGSSRFPYLELLIRLFLCKSRHFSNRS